MLPETIRKPLQFSVFQGHRNETLMGKTEIHLVINGTEYSRIDQVKFFKRLSFTNLAWSILEYFAPNVLLEF